MAFEKLDESIVNMLIDKYIKKDDIVAFGSSRHAEHFLKRLALKAEEEGLKIKLVPTSAKLTEIAHHFGLEIVSINDYEIDVSIEFAELVSKDFDYIKRDTHSLVRDKMIAQSASELIVAVEKENFVKTLSGVVPFEICTFGWKHTVLQLDRFGEAWIREENNKPYKTESGNYIAEVLIDKIFDLDELEISSKNIPGVLETGLFLGYADRVLLQSKDKIEMKSIMNREK